MMMVPRVRMGVACLSIVIAGSSFLEIKASKTGASSNAAAAASSTSSSASNTQLRRVYSDVTLPLASSSSSSSSSSSTASDSSEFSISVSMLVTQKRMLRELLEGFTGWVKTTREELTSSFVKDCIQEAPADGHFHDQSSSSDSSDDDAATPSERFHKKVEKRVECKMKTLSGDYLNQKNAGALAGAIIVSILTIYEKKQSDGAFDDLVLTEVLPNLGELLKYMDRFGMQDMYYQILLDKKFVAEQQSSITETFAVRITRTYHIIKANDKRDDLIRLITLSVANHNIRNKLEELVKLLSSSIHAARVGGGSPYVGFVAGSRDLSPVPPIKI